MSKASTASAANVLNVLAEKHFKAGPYCMLREVKNGTGYNQQDRFADALVISTWPSRGIWFGGVEVKVARSDWKNELEKPAKSAEIQRFCSYWWVATPPDIVRPGELPENWGHIEVTGKAAKVLKEAPKLEAEPLTPRFVASVLRNAQVSQAVLRDVAVREGYERARAEFDAEAVAQLRGEANHAQALADQRERDMGYLKQDVERLKGVIKSFELKTGLEIGHHHWRDDRTLKLLAAARALDVMELGRLEKVLRVAADSVAEAAAMQAGKSELEQEAAAS